MKALVAKLVRQGMNAEEIAAELKVPIGSVSRLRRGISSLVGESAVSILELETQEEHSLVEAKNELFRATDLLSPIGARVISIDVAEINEEIVRYLAQHPEKMRDLHPRRFEELVAELFRSKGYEVEVTQYSKDGGFDIRAVRKTDVGLGLTLIECKRFSEWRPVGVSIVRRLYGVVEEHKATSGLLVTTSYFTQSAQVMQNHLKYRLDLADFGRLKNMLAEYKRPNKSSEPTLTAVTPRATESKPK